MLLDLFFKKLFKLLGSHSPLWIVANFPPARKGLPRGQP
jgi:hypothetical protein